VQALLANNCAFSTRFHETSFLMPFVLRHKGNAEKEKYLQNIEKHKTKVNSADSARTEKHNKQ